VADPSLRRRTPQLKVGEAQLLKETATVCRSSLHEQRVAPKKDRINFEKFRRGLE